MSQPYLFIHKIELLQISTSPMMLKFGLEIGFGVIQKGGAAVFETLNSLGVNVQNLVKMADFEVSIFPVKRCLMLAANILL